jgi:hypothetical protein
MIQKCLKPYKNVVLAGRKGIFFRVGGADLKYSPFCFIMRFLSLGVFIFSVSLLHAQTAVELDLLLETREVNFAQASRFVLVVAGTADERTEAGAVYVLVEEKGWLPERASPETTLG